MYMKLGLGIGQRVGRGGERGELVAATFTTQFWPMSSRWAAGPLGLDLPNL